jgi:hypothetical protein
VLSVNFISLLSASLLRFVLGPPFLNSPYFGTSFYTHSWDCVQHKAESKRRRMESMRALSGDNDRKPI